MKYILIVDDDVNLCLALQEELIAAGYRAEYVISADEVFPVLEKGKPDLMLLDLKMPVHDGFYVLDQLNKRSIQMRVIVLTAYADVKSAIEAAKLGAIDFISKPYDVDDLLFALGRALQ